jgi:methanogenic corrinoid protein MtbC1
MKVVMSAGPGLANEDASMRAVEAVERLSDDAIRWVADELCRRYAPLMVVRGTRGRFHTQQDLRYHLEFLNGALETGAPIFFTDYVGWLATVLESRGVPRQSLDESLELLRLFFDDALESTLSARISDVLEQGRRALASGRGPSEPLYCAYRPPDLPHVAALTKSLINGDVETARSFSRMTWEASGDYVEVATRLFQPALYDVGILWQRNQITVAQEHLATAIVQTLLTQIYLTAPRFSEPSGRTVVLAGVEGNQHVLGLRMVSDAFEIAGWTVQFLGANTPTDALVAHLDSVKPEVVGLSTSIVQQLPTLRRLIGVMRAELGSQCPTIMVGGLPTNQLNEAWRWLGADAWSPDAAKAVTEVT